MDAIEMLASLPPIQSAVKIGGDGSARIQLDVSASEMAALVRLIAYGTGKLLKVSVELAGDE